MLKQLINNQEVTYPDCVDQSFILYLEINGADANEPPVYFIAFAGDSGNYENVTSTSSLTSSLQTLTSSQKSKIIRTTLLPRKKTSTRSCNRQKSCQTSTHPSP
jgi:hypothetical protein